MDQRQIIVESTLNAGVNYQTYLRWMAAHVHLAYHFLVLRTGEIYITRALEPDAECIIIGVVCDAAHPMNEAQRDAITGLAEDFELSSVTQ